MLQALSSIISAILEAHQSAVSFAMKGSLVNHAVTRTEYLESGSNACRRKFRDWRTAPVQLDIEEPPEGGTYPEKEKDKEKEKEKDKERDKEKETDLGKKIETLKLLESR